MSSRFAAFLRWTSLKNARVSGQIASRGAEDFEGKRAILEMSQDNRRKWAERQLAGYFATPALESFETPELEKRGAPFDLHVVGAMSTYLVFALIGPDPRPLPERLRAGRVQAQRGAEVGEGLGQLAECRK